ncbi:MAG: adenylate kinase [Pseudomonadota bacterium]
MGIQDFTRFNVVGSSGSGKSTLGRLIAEHLGLPRIELDALYWGPDWQEPPEQEFLVRVRAALDSDRWVLDGNYSRTVPIKWQRVQVVVWLDLPYAVILYQVISRTLRRVFRQEELWSGNRESFRKAFFSRDSVIWWSLTNLARVRRGYETAMKSEDFAHIRFVRLRSRRAVREFVTSLGGDGA